MAETPQYVVVDGIAYPLGTGPAPSAVSAPAVPAVASPFVRVSGGTTARDSRDPVVVEAGKTWPGDRVSQKAYIAAHNVPRYTCTVDVTYRRRVGTDEHGQPIYEDVTGSLHGFTTPRATGDPCDGIAGLAKGTACTGTIR